MLVARAHPAVHPQAATVAETMAAAVVLHLVRALSLLEPHTFMKWYDVSAVVC